MYFFTVLPQVGQEIRGMNGRRQGSAQELELAVVMAKQLRQNLVVCGAGGVHSPRFRDFTGEAGRRGNFGLSISDEKRERSSVSVMYSTTFCT